MERVQLMGVLNLTPDSYYAESRTDAERIPSRIEELLRDGASIIDIGAVSTRPGAEAVDVEHEWMRLEPALKAIGRSRGYALSIDTTSAEIVRRSYAMVGKFIVNDISAGADDTEMLDTVAQLGLGYIAMHKRGTPGTMDALTDYPGGIIGELLQYFRDFESRAEAAGLREWIIDPGLGFAKTTEQNWEILERLPELAVLGRPILISAQDKRFTCGDNARAHRLAVDGGASILRVHRPAEL